jgi:hypothetical protein
VLASASPLENRNLFRNVALFRLNRYKTLRLLAPIRPAAGARPHRTLRRVIDAYRLSPYNARRYHVPLGARYRTTGTRRPDYAGN